MGKLEMHGKNQLYNCQIRETLSFQLHFLIYIKKITINNIKLIHGVEAVLWHVNPK